MSVLVDTSVWSLALRRNTSPPLDLIKLIDSNEVNIIGPLRQELLSGIKEMATFAKLKSYLDAFPDLPLFTQHYVEGARIGNLCRKAGVQASSIDFLICAVARLEGLSLYSHDNDFTHISTVVPIKRYPAK